LDVWFKEKPPRAWMQRFMILEMALEALRVGDLESGEYFMQGVQKEELSSEAVEIFVTHFLI
jgi:hypothetical protein